MSKKAKSKAKVYEFDPVIYPMRLWIAVKLPFEEAAEAFYGYDTNYSTAVDLQEKEYNSHWTAIATCTPVGHKENGWKGILCNIMRPKDFTVGVVAHESTHVCDFMCEQFGVGGYDFEKGEARAYFTQWVASCMDKVRTNKMK